MRQLTFYFFKSVLFQENFQINSSRESEYLSETQQNPPIHLLSRGGGGFVWALFGPEPGSIPNTHGFSFTRQGRSRTRYLPISLPRISATVKRWGIFRSQLFFKISSIDYFKGKIPAWFGPTLVCRLNEQDSRPKMKPTAWMDAPCG